MLWDARERKVQPEQQMVIKGIEQRENPTILVAEGDSKELVGFLMAVGGKCKKK